jgi:hypothetical protein
VSFLSQERVPLLQLVLAAVTKAVTGTLIAIALKEGLLDSLDHPVLEFFKDRKIANVDDRKRAMTVRHLLDMTSGFEWEEGLEDGRAQSLTEMGRSADWGQFILDGAHAWGPLLLQYRQRLSAVCDHPETVRPERRRLCQRQAIHAAPDRAAILA